MLLDHVLLNAGEFQFLSSVFQCDPRVACPMAPAGGIPGIIEKIIVQQGSAHHFFVMAGHPEKLGQSVAVISDSCAVEQSGSGAVLGVFL